MTDIHLIGNAHLDPVWLWRWTEGCAEVLATFRSALDRLKECPDFVFTCAGAAYYDWVERIDPAMFREVQSYVAEGRWVIVGGWWIQPDCNAPSGESFARHALYSQRYYQKKFGRLATVGYNVDSFGHNAMLPQLLKQSGLRAYVYMRPNDDNEKRYPFKQNVFLWRGVDGSEVPAFRIPDAYCTWGREQTLKAAEKCARLADEYHLPEMCFYGVGNHGGGPTQENLRTLAPLAQADGRYAFSDPDRYFDALPARELNVLEGDLQHHASGCYTAVMDVKRLNRLAENRLIAAEKYMALAAQLGLTEEVENLEDAWRTVLFNQFHDIMGGCSIEEAYQDAFEGFGESLSAAAKAANIALQKIAWNVDTLRGGARSAGKADFRLWDDGARGVPLVVFNPHSFPLRAPIRTGAPSSRVTDDEGLAVPAQTVRSSVTNGQTDKWETLFVADLPPMGWKLYWLHPNASPTPAAPGALGHLENEFLRVELKGGLSRVYDKAQGRELLGAPLRLLVIDEHKADTWAHNIFSFREEAGDFTLTEARLLESGPVREVAELRYAYGASRASLRLALYRDSPILRLTFRVDWREEHKMLKLCFPTPDAQACDTAGIPYGFLPRTANGKEQPMQGWVALGGVGLASDSRAAYDALDGELRLTALRSPLYADHYGARDEHCHFTEQGEHAFRVSLMGLAGDFVPLQREAERLMCPPERLLGAYHEGKLGAAGSLLRLDAANVAATVVKGAEEGAGWIVRLRETAGRKQTEARVEMPLLGVSWRAAFRAQQIRTFRIADGEAVEVDLLERPVTL